MLFKSKIKYLLFISFIFTSCEAFFTYNWFQGAADYSGISVDEAISSGDPAVMQTLYDQLVVEAAAASGAEAADLYLDAAELALGISGLSDPAILFQAPELLSGGDGGVTDVFSILTETGLNLDALENVAAMVASAESSDPGSVPPEMWLFSAAGSGAVVVNDAGDIPLEDFLGGDPIATNTDVKDAVQALVYAIDILPDDIANQLYDNQADLITKGVVFP